ncbi:type IV secretion system protein TraC [Pseudovibrio ascidiaceicola]|uniref:type IV secretion system protein TraC n=1 Tax=Pseudovibrio ascidiaceicola TaxID=285279 RepID=UPI003D36898B
MRFISIKNILSDHIIPETVRASSLIPVLAYSETDQLFLMDDQTLGFTFMCQPIPAGDEKIQERVVGLINQDLPKDSSMQIVLFRSPDINMQMYQMETMRDGFRDPLLDQVLKERIDFLQEHTVDNVSVATDMGVFDNGIVQDLKLIISCKIPIKNPKPTEKELLEVSQIQGKLESTLNLIKVSPQRLDARGYIRLMSTLLNWGRNASWRNDATGYETDRTINEQLFDPETQLDVEPRALCLGDQHLKVLSAKKLPDAYYFGDAITYIGDISGGNSSIKENYFVVMNIMYPDAEQLKNQLERKRHFTVNQAHGPMTSLVPVLGDKKQGFDLLHERMKEGSKPIRISYSVVLSAPSKKRVEAAAIAARNIWRESRFELMEDRYLQLPMLLNSLPLCTDAKAIKDLFRYKTLTAEHATVLAPIFGEWKGTGTPHIALMSRNGQLMTLSLHDSNSNKNAVIAAESGSGKSFLLNELILAYMSEGAQVWVIDAGKSYEKLCDTLDGDFVHFEEGTNVCLNPFELIDSYEEEEDGIVGIVSNMASPKGTLNELQEERLKEIISKGWAEHNKALKIDHIAEACLKDTDQRVRDIGAQLFSFTSKGNYGRYFSGKNSINFRKQLTVLELDELQGRTNLRQVVLLQLIYQIQQEVYRGERNRKKVVIVDEAWDLLKEGEVAKFMEHAYRKFRKYGGSVIIATQSVNDLYQNAVGRAIAENSAMMMLLGQRDETIESVKKNGHLSMGEGGFRALKTVHTIAGAYSEIFIKSNVGTGIGRLIVGEFQKLLYSTDPRDVQRIEELRRHGYSVSDAIHMIIDSRTQNSENAA